MMNEARTKSLIINKKDNTAYLTIPILFIKILGWKNQQKIYISLYDDKIILSDKLPQIAGTDMIDISTTNLNESKSKNTLVYRLWFKKEIVDDMKFIENNTFNLEILDNDKILMKKLQV